MFCNSCGLPRGCCASCGVKTPEGSVYCWKCGFANPASPQCSKCSSHMAIGSMFCHKCGQKQDTSNAPSSLSSKSIVLMLNKVKVLNGLSEGEKLALGGMCKERSFGEKENIFLQGAAPDGFYMMISGQATVLYTDPASKDENEVGILGEGDYFGETALLSSDNRTATVRTNGPVRCLFLDRASFEACFTKKSQVHFANRRIAVSAEAVSTESNRVSKIGPSARTTEMSKETRDMLLETTSSCPLFSNLDLKHRIAIIMSMFRVEVPANKVLIKQGEQGSNLYIVEKGNFAVTILDSKTNQTQRIATKGPRSLFGELALMYNAPRAATVTSLVQSVVWVVDRFTFRRIALDLGQEKINNHKAFLSKCDILTTLTEYERGKIAEALEEVCFNPRTVIFEQGQSAEHMYFISNGEVEVLKDEKVVGKLGVGQYFGELALLNESKRAATVRTLGAVDCLKLDKQAVKLLLGPIDLKEIAKQRYGAGAVKDVVASPSNKSGSTSSPAENTDSPLLNIKQSDLKILGTLGKGSFGHVQLVQDKDNAVYALKGVNKKQIVETQQQSHIMSEKWALCQLKHPMIIRLYATFKSQNKLYFLLEPVLGGELFTFLRKRKLFTEDWSRFYAGCVTLAFEYMHSKQILYRDLKPENLLMADDGYLKVTDFGFAKKVVDKTWTLCGTPDYLAPEIVASKGHNKGVDYWTLGVLIYEMVASYPPFYDEDPMQTYAKIVEGTVKYPSHFSQNCKNIIAQFLSLKPLNRLGCTIEGATAIKNHAWFKGFDWNALFNKTIKAPYAPKIKSKTDTSNFVDYGDKDEEMMYVDDGSNWDKNF